MDAMDHVLIAVRDIEAAAIRLRERFGLATVLPGGSPFPGVANAVIPIGPPAYLELVMATDPDLTPEAAAIAARAADGDALFTWVIEPDDLAAAAAARGLDDAPDPDAGWQTLGGVRADRPFLIRYSRDRAGRVEGWRRRYDEVAPPARPGGFTSVTVGGDPAAMSAWIGTIDVPVSFAGGAAGLRSVTIATADGEVVLTDESLRG